MTELDPTISGRVRWNAEGLLPAVVQQHDTGEVLMLGWMDEEALARTMASGRATYDIQRRAGEGHGDLVSALALALISPNWIAHPRVIATESTGRIDHDHHRD